MTTPSRMTPPFAQPPAGSYPTGYAGFERAWDGAAWEGVPARSADAPELHLRHPIGHAFTRPSLYIAVVGVVLGFFVAVIGAGIGSSWIAGIGGGIGVAGPLVAACLAVRSRLRIGSLHVRSALLWGAVSGAFAIAVSFYAERALMPFLPPGSMASGGPIEEITKLLIPFVLLLVGPAAFEDPRIGVWTVVVAGAVFGIAEGALYVGGALDDLHSTTLTAQQILQGDAAHTGYIYLTRIWEELGHVFWTGGAAVLIWLGAHRRGRAFTGLGALGLLIAIALHTINDTVIAVGDLYLFGIYPLLGILWIVLSYVLWMRPRVRMLVPPDAIATVAKRWRPRLSKRMRAEATPGA
ncbi:PrsW family glutamic-type intramembrane protease [Cnuibacter sp. UC19_7]|uniref:PrsW family glutamic-type intramembrane protease n=1 Tax=Cnuibacter sp. UC19_7 TaxID=3350166 RepID=UPI00366EF02E